MLVIRTVTAVVFSLASCFGAVAAEKAIGFACSQHTPNTDYLLSEQIAPRINDNDKGQILIVSLCGDNEQPIYREFFTRIYHPDSPKKIPSLAALSTLEINRHLDPSPNTHATGLLAKIPNQPYGYALKMRIRVRGQTETDISHNLNFKSSNEIDFVQAGFKVKIRILE